MAPVTVFRLNAQAPLPHAGNRFDVNKELP